MNWLQIRSMSRKQKSMRGGRFSKAWPLVWFPGGKRGIHSTEWLHIQAPQPPPQLLPNIRWRNGDQEARSLKDSCESSFSILQTNFVLVSCNALPSGGWEFLNQKPLTSNHNQPMWNFRNYSQKLHTRTYGNNTITICNTPPGLSRLENS